MMYKLEKVRSEVGFESDNIRIVMDFFKVKEMTKQSVYMPRRNLYMKICTETLLWHDAMGAKAWKKSSHEDVINLSESLIKHKLYYNRRLAEDKENIDEYDAEIIPNGFDLAYVKFEGFSITHAKDMFMYLPVPNSVHDVVKYFNKLGYKIDKWDYEMVSNSNNNVITFDDKKIIYDRIGN